LGNDVDEQLRLFGGYVGTCIERYPGDVCRRMCEGLNEALADRISRIDKDNGNRSSRIFGRLSGRRGSGDNYIDLETDQLGSRILELVGIPGSKSAFNQDVLSLNPPKISQSLKETVTSRHGRSKPEIPYPSGLQRLLPARHRRPRRHSAEPRDERAPARSTDWHQIASRAGPF